METKHQKLVSRMTASADGGTGLLHKITKPRAWREGVQIVKEEEKDAKSSARCEEKRKEWAKHWQRDREVQDQKENNVEEDMLRLLEKERQQRVTKQRERVR